MSGAKKTQTTGMSPTLPAVSQSDSIEVPVWFSNFIEFEKVVMIFK